MQYAPTLDGPGVSPNGLIGRVVLFIINSSTWLQGANTVPSFLKVSRVF